MEKGKQTGVLKTPTKAKRPTGSTWKVARALEVRESAAKARKGKPLAFPAHRMHP